MKNPTLYVCQFVQALKVFIKRYNMKIYLLTHQRELAKESNTGQLVKQLLQDQAEIIIWQRTQPHPQLLQAIENQSTALIYPIAGSTEMTSSTTFDNYILLDGTWQEARKMYNKSTYLQALPKVKLVSDQASVYNLRRNQLVDGLCTAECVIAMLSFHQQMAAENLQQRLLEFLQLSN
ncbi:MAG: tRNA-uridine aminocarboxypropyltransferase [Oceanospirillaceae bacterium]